MTYGAGLRLGRYFAAAIAGALIARLLFWPEITERIEIRETVRTDTVYQTYRDTIRIESERVREVYMRDTVIKTVRLPINRFSGLEPTIFGDVSYTGLVAGHFLKMELNTNFRVPELKTTINRETNRTRVLKQKGLFAIGGVDSRFHYSAGFLYQNDRSIFGYDYNFSFRSHGLKVGFKIF